MGGDEPSDEDKDDHDDDDDDDDDDDGEDDEDDEDDDDDDDDDDGADGDANGHIGAQRLTGNPQKSFSGNKTKALGAAATTSGPGTAAAALAKC